MRSSAYLEELTLQSDKLLEELCRRYGRGLDRDDARMEAAAELICAGKDYKKVQGCYEFWDYVTGRVVQRLELKRKEANRIRKVENGYSLDQPVAEGEEAARDVFFSNTGRFCKRRCFDGLCKRASRHGSDRCVGLYKRLHRSGNFGLEPPVLSGFGGDKRAAAFKNGTVSFHLTDRKEALSWGCARPRTAEWAKRKSAPSAH